MNFQRASIERLNTSARARDPCRVAKTLAMSRNGFPRLSRGDFAPAPHDHQYWQPPASAHPARRRRGFGC